MDEVSNFPGYEVFNVVGLVRKPAHGGDFVDVQKEYLVIARTPFAAIEYAIGQLDPNEEFAFRQCVATMNGDDLHFAEEAQDIDDIIGGEVKFD